MSRKEELKQEAAAWRKLAEWCVKNDGFLCTMTSGWAHGWDARPPFAAPWADIHEQVSGMARTAVVQTHKFWNTTALAAPSSDEHARVMFCLLMALECEAEAKEVPLREH